MQRVSMDRLILGRYLSGLSMIKLILGRYFSGLSMNRLYAISKDCLFSELAEAS